MTDHTRPIPTALRNAVLLAACLLSAAADIRASAAPLPAADAPRAIAPLADAAEKPDWPRVRALLKGRADVNAAQADGMTALHWAAQHDDAEMTRELIAADANAKAENRYGVTPLALACTNGNADV